MNKGIGLLLLAAGTVWMGVLSIPDSRLHVVFCDVGQGDATLISYKTNQLLIDGGPSDKIFECLEKHMPFWDRTIEVAVATHKQQDHEFGIKEVAKRYRVISYEPVLRQGQEVRMGDIIYKIWWPNDKVLGTNTLGEDNNEGIVGTVSFGEFDVLLTADVDPKNYENVEGVEVVKVPHHGSKFQWERAWYEKINPALAVISVGKNSYGHPSDEVIKGLRDEGIKVLRTDENGTIEIVSDGIKWWVR